MSYSSLDFGPSLFGILVYDTVLVYAPLQETAALVNRTAAESINLLTDDLSNNHKFPQLAPMAKKASVPQPLSGDFQPSLLGFIPTRQCNIACRYCGFTTLYTNTAIISEEKAQQAVDWYLEELAGSGQTHGEIHFFGGEPFFAVDSVKQIVEYATTRSKAAGIDLSFFIITNGVFSEATAKWASRHFSSICLSFDGPQEIQNRHRPTRTGQGTYEQVSRTARILADGKAEFYVRACVTQATVKRMAETAAWFCEQFQPDGICFEPLQFFTGIDHPLLQEPDPWDFISNFMYAAEIMAPYDTKPIHTTADVSARRVSFCPVGSDAAILSPDGSITTCYLLEQEWQAKGLNLRLGQINDDGTVSLDIDAINGARALNVLNKPTCSSCFAKWHCAGGCHVNHPPPPSPGQYDARCIEARGLILLQILFSLGRADLAHRLLEDIDRLRQAVLQPNDSLACVVGKD